LIDVPEMMQRILAELEEAGEENVSSMLNTIVVPSGERSELAVYKSALAQLVEQDLVRVEFETDDNSRPPPQQNATNIVQSLDTYLRYSGEDREWGFVDGNRAPVVIGTDSGLARAEAILEDRGYQWWRQRN
jgi:hypothetical protein